MAGVFDPNNTLVGRENILNTGLPSTPTSQFNTTPIGSGATSGFSLGGYNLNNQASQGFGLGDGYLGQSGITSPDLSTPGVQDVQGMSGFEKGTSVAKLGIGAFNAYMNWDALKLAKESQAEQEKQFWQQYGDQKALTQEALAGKYQRQASAKGGGADATEATAWKKARSVLA